jgi:hypothetical protein
VRSVISELEDAQKLLSRVPVLETLITNGWEATRRWDLVALNSATVTNAKHDICVAANGDVTRVRVDGANVKRNTVEAADVGTPANFDSWVDDIVGLASGNVACDAMGTRVCVVYNNGNNVSIYESTDSGQTFGAAAFVFTTVGTCQDLAVCYKNTSGDLAIAACSTTQLQIIKRTGGAFGAASTHGTVQNTLNGVALTRWADWEMLVTGTEVTTLRPTVWMTGYGEGAAIASNTWGAWRVQFQSDAAQCTYQAPSMVYNDGWRGAFVDVPLYTGGATRTYFTYLHEDLPWNVGNFAFRSPVPRDHHITNGIALASDSNINDAEYVYAQGLNGVLRAAV